MTPIALRTLALAATLATPLGALAQEAPLFEEEARVMDALAEPGTPLPAGEEATLVAMADDVQMLKRMPPMGVPPRVAERIGLTPEQQKQIQQLSFEANEKLIDLEAANRKAQLQLKRLLAQGEPEEKAVHAQVDAIARTEAAVRKNRLSLLLRIRKLVGPEKWQKLEAEMPRRVERRLRRMGPPEEGEVRREIREQRRGGEGR